MMKDRGRNSSSLFQKERGQRDDVRDKEPPGDRGHGGVVRKRGVRRVAERGVGEQL